MGINCQPVIVESRSDVLGEGSRHGDISQSDGGDTITFVTTVQNIAGANAYAGPNAAGANVITPAGTTITITDNGNEDHVDINPAFQFSFESPAQRLFVVDTPVSYICDLTAGTLTRYSGYNIQTSQPVPPTSGGSLLAQNITDCSFSYQPGTSQRAAIVSLKIRLKVPGRNDRIQLLQQVHLENVP